MMGKQEHEVFLSEIVGVLEDLLCILVNKKCFQERIKVFSGYSIELQDWLSYHYTSTFNEFVQTKPVEPKKNEILPCECALLGIISDWWMDPPRCDRLCNAIDDEFAKSFWEDLINSLINDNASERVKRRINKALEHVKADLAEKPPKTQQNTTSAKPRKRLACVKRIPRWIYYTLGTLASLLTILYLLGLLERIKDFIYKIVGSK